MKQSAKQRLWYDVGLDHHDSLWSPCHLCTILYVGWLQAPAAAGMNDEELSKLRQQLEQLEKELQVQQLDRKQAQVR